MIEFHTMVDNGNRMLNLNEPAVFGELICQCLFVDALQ